MLQKILYMYITLLYQEEDLSGNTDLSENTAVITATTIPGAPATVMVMHTATLAQDTITSSF